jgi:hypothetical protein
MMRQLRWTPLAERRRVQRLTFFYKIINDLVAVPGESIHIYKNQRKQRHSHTRTVNVIATSTNIYKKSFIPRTILDWNSLQETIVSTTKPEEFKSALQDRYQCD